MKNHGLEVIWLQLVIISDHKKLWMILFIYQILCHKIRIIMLIIGIEWNYSHVILQRDDLMNSLYFLGLSIYRMSLKEVEDTLRNGIAVPTHLFKCILAENFGENTKALGCFIIPNKPISSEDPLIKYQVPLEKVERSVGTLLFPELDESEVEDLCSVCSCELLSQERVNHYLKQQRKKSKQDN
eukprot:TRINITY_DN4912_c0_g1_i1.p1 TRINITY_DN4912_c0_g1~~TRINITY_DN4912_c0_g1_i1.p1  ORF type:complete len:184 (-),score=12.63 TRINITY_DN4912_c0_g1_i1:24-575(-)